MPYNPAGFFESTPYPFPQSALIPTVPGGYQRDLDNLTPNRFQPRRRQPLHVPVVSPPDLPPIRSQEYQEPVYPSSRPTEQPLVQPPAVNMAHARHKLNHCDRQRSRSSDSNSPAPALPHFWERRSARRGSPSLSSDSVVTPPIAAQRPPRQPHVVGHMSSSSRTSSPTSRSISPPLRPVPIPTVTDEADPRLRPLHLSSDSVSDSYTPPIAHFSRRPGLFGPREEHGLNISIDVGSEFSTIAYSAPSISGIREITSWSGSNESINRIPTCLVYDSHGSVQAWGIRAKRMELEKDWKRFEQFKFSSSLSAPDEFGSIPPYQESPLHLLVDYIGSLINHTKHHDNGMLDHPLNENVHFIVRGSWGLWGVSRYFVVQEAYSLASSRAGYPNGFGRLKIMTKVEAAAIYCVYLDFFPVGMNNAYCVCNVGAGAVDLGAYKFLGKETHPKIAEACIRSETQYYGSHSLDLSFRDLLYKLQKEEGINLDPPNLQHYMDTFAEFKLTYRGEGTGSNLVYFDCFDPSDHRGTGLVNAALAIPSGVLHRSVFEPVITKVVRSIESQLKKIAEPVDALFLVGGFSANEYLFTHVKETFGARIKSIVRPRGADVAASRGAVLYGSNTSHSSPIISSNVSPKSYIVSVDLPAEPEDLAEHAAWVSTNSQKIKMCANRALYIVRKGENVSKREQIKVKFRAYSESISNDEFTTTMHISDSEETLRYTVDGGIEYVCQLRINLRPLYNDPVGRVTSRPYIDFTIGFTFENGLSGIVYDDTDHHRGEVSVIGIKKYS
ncbi:hypothetical protein BS47DRAFT_1352200 [Hydnum rufescens UP504]|uniref:Actin-like ATPase domain-containing protein n=1 Tax=Hydnum rufescens UP504 TaxID=1448309 RepID=A0A9P6DLK1_9AGAM|nr:hypothetical protein BS47DRAFT_1352200 [Hydnum rufescens UP504]